MVVSLICGVAAESTNCLCICGRRTWGPSTLCLSLQRPTVFITIVWMSLQFKRSWLRSPRISQSFFEQQYHFNWTLLCLLCKCLWREEAKFLDWMQFVQIAAGFQIFYNWATILWISKKEILDCDRILRFWKWPSGMGRSLPLTPDQKPVGVPLG